MDRIKILVVEDESVIAKDIQTILTEAGYIVPYTASNSKDAVKYAELLKPDLILMDVIIQGPVDGISTAQIINQLYDIPIIFLSAYSDKNTLDRARTVGSFGYLLKPCDEKELLIAVDFGLQKARMDRMIKNQNKLLASVISNIPTGALVINLEGDIELLNGNAQKILGWTENEILKKPFKNYVLNFDPAKAEPNKPYEVSYLNRDGAERPINLQLQKLYSNDGQITGILAYISEPQKNSQKKAS
jgi:PAS domain S-box-containing protein